MDENCPPKVQEPLKPNTVQAQMPHMDLNLTQHGHLEARSIRTDETHAAAKDREETTRTKEPALEVAKESLDITSGATTGNVSLQNTIGDTNTGSASSGIDFRGSGSARIDGKTGDITAK
ncbi:hypothetical protein HBH69_223660 [Parastagonospora nodorum]|nr:hypothetical protein HBH61_228710 [Parastagonospora nodorum]KAH5138628.1 hypothetical protein HBH69_223660 [Parastagonospora nodorum]KAH5342581.1 hypothetical protein HBI48_222520 [Parastagonospora nodorum]KAH5397003.1 hypothetical protein HBI32_196440 [Parastagonospora nodorum]KAH5497186.1 hypothetical protein HBI52_190730 [Parastagonospora nodorum]